MAAYVKISYNVTSSTDPTYVATYAGVSELVEDWIDHVTIGSSGGTVITIEPWAPEDYQIWYYAYTFPTTGVQDLYFFSKTNEIPDYAFRNLDGNNYPGHVLSIDCSQSNNDITGIGESTFSLNRGMQSAYLSDNITKIGRNAFEGASAMTVCNIPESLSAIPASMFQFCYSLQHVRIPDSVQSIGVSAFADCRSLEDVYLGSGLTLLNTSAFLDCAALTSITATSRNVPITYYTNTTFRGVHTGGTLYYPAGYESEYGPESGMLGTQQYLLGYYDWNGIPTGTTPGNIYCDWASAWTPNTPCNGYSDNDAQLHVENCTLSRFSSNFEIIHGDSSFRCDVERTHSTQNWEPLGGIRARVSGNTTNATRSGVLHVIFYDTSGNSYNQDMTITQAPCGYVPPVDKWVYCNPSAQTIGGGHGGINTSTVYFYCSGFTAEGAFQTGASLNIPYTVSGDSGVITGVTGLRYDSSQQRYRTTVNYTSNDTDQLREVYVTFALTDTSGNTFYPVWHGTQGLGFFAYASPSANTIDFIRQTTCTTIVPVNGEIQSLVINSIDYTGDFDTIPSPSINGNNICVEFPENTSAYERAATYYIYYGIKSGSTAYSNTIVWRVTQSPKPVGKNITLDDTRAIVLSGAGNITRTVVETNCEYSAMTYITGGTFPTTATSTGHTIMISYPENNTGSQRTGYTYFTFYDTDGNAYGPITLTIIQNAGGSPGPDPDTGYVYTSLTISDNEQHRFFLEAQPGVVYSAAGQYYKTIKACEARYSLYYVNSYGGVDVLPFRGGGQKKTDNLTRYNYTRSFRNNTMEFENVNYMTEIKPAWELKTGYMTDEQSKRMHELVESTIVYLYDAEEKEYTPVVMTDKKLEYKTFHNQGKKFYNYTVNVEESQSRERR